jgi:two-component system response regulator YesN
MNLLIVDDEPWAVQGILDGINWEQLNFSKVLTAGSYREAVGIFENTYIDILVSDIEMPGESGLKLIEYANTHSPNTECIILTCHDEFDYAKKAISIGIEDYLLKPFTPDEILSSLTKTAQRIDIERKQLSDISKLKAELKSNEMLKKKEFLNNLVHGSENAEDVMTKSQELGISLISRFYKVLISSLTTGVTKV